MKKKKLKKLNLQKVAISKMQSQKLVGGTILSLYKICAQQRK
ncbi:MAG: hypothetical protein AAF611_02595 [Bacteroidota bacterium]